MIAAGGPAIGKDASMSDVFQNPMRPFESIGREGYTLQIASALPDPVPIGHFEMNSLEPVVDEIVSRAEYLERIQQACAAHGERYTVRFYRHEDGFDASILDHLDQIRSLQIDPACAVACMRLSSDPASPLFDPDALHADVLCRVTRIRAGFSSRASADRA